MNSLSTLSKDLLITYNTYLFKGLIEQKSKEIDLSLKEPRELAEKLQKQLDI